MSSHKRSQWWCGICKDKPGEGRPPKEVSESSSSSAQKDPVDEKSTVTQPLNEKTPAVHDTQPITSSLTNDGPADEPQSDAAASIDTAAADTASSRTPPSLLRSPSARLRLQRRSSASLLQDVLRRKLSRDSGWTVGALPPPPSSRDSHASWTEEQLERLAEQRHVAEEEQRRAMEGRLRREFRREKVLDVEDERPVGLNGLLGKKQRAAAQAQVGGQLDGQAGPMPETEGQEGSNGEEFSSPVQIDSKDTKGYTDDEGLEALPENGSTIQM